MILFKEPPCICFLKTCLDCLARHPRRSRPKILQDLSALATLIGKSKEPEDGHLFEPIKCRLKRDLLRQARILQEEEVRCTNAVGLGPPIKLAKFLDESLVPMLEFFDELEVLSFSPLHVESANQEDAEALAGFIEHLKTLKNLKEVRLTFLSVQAFVDAVEMGLDKLSFVQLQVEVKSLFKFDGYDLFASTLAKGIKLDKLKFAEGYIYSSDKLLKEVLQFLSALENVKVCPFAFSSIHLILECRSGLKVWKRRRL